MPDKPFPEWTKEELVTLLKTDVEEWNHNREVHSGFLPDLSLVHLEGTSLVGANLERVDLQNASLAGANLVGANLSRAFLRGTDLKSAYLQRANLQKANLEWANLAGARLIDANLSEADVSGADLRETDLFRTNLRMANLSRAKMSGADLKGTYLDGADLRNANLVGVDVDHTTSIDKATLVAGMTLSKYTSVILHKNGLTDSQVMALKIVDDVATLRRSFGGIWGALHFISLLLFLFPYAFFLSSKLVADRYYQAQIRIGVKTPDDFQMEPLGSSLWQFLHGRPMAQVGIFWALLLYNLLRLALLWKTKRLEHEQAVMGFPARFEFATHPNWRFFYRMMNWIQYGAYALVGWHTWAFMRTLILV